MTARSIDLGNWLNARLRNALGWRFGRSAAPRQAGQNVMDRPSTALTLCPAVGPPASRPDTADTLAFGQWPEDPHAVPGWRLRIEANGKGLWIPIRTRADYERQIALCVARLEAETTALTTAEPLESAEAARCFLRWLRETRRTGRFTDDELSNAYIEHCKAVRVAPSSEAHMRKHLIAMAGVHKGLVENRSGPKRSRSTVWTIDQGLASAIEPMRRAA